MTPKWIRKAESATSERPGKKTASHPVNREGMNGLVLQANPAAATLLGDEMKSYTKRDFEITWFSGTGKGGQNRNKHQNCCRIRHIETGLMAVGQNGRDRVENQKAAFERLVAKLIALDSIPEERRNTKEIVRTYHFEDNRVTDHASGLKRPTAVVMDGHIDEFVFHLDREAERPESGRA